MKYQIDIIEGPEAGKRYLFHQAHIVVGRGSQADLSLENDLKVSRRHVAISPKRRRAFIVKDLGSRGGTFVNGRPIRDLTVPDGATVRIGDSILRLTIRTPTPSAGDPTPSPQSFVWARQALWAVAVLLAAIPALLVTLSRNSGTDETMQPSLELAQALLNEGHLDKALAVLSALDAEHHPGVDEMYTFVVRELKPGWERAQEFERKLNLQDALDEWTILRLKILESEKDKQGTHKQWTSLCEWIQNQRIRQLEERLKKR